MSLGKQGGRPRESTITGKKGTRSNRMEDTESFIEEANYCACKVVEKKSIGEKRLKLIENEILNQESIECDNCVKLKKAIETTDRFYIFMEFCNGGDLKELMEAKSWDLHPSII